MIKGKYLSICDDLSDAVNIRREIFAADLDEKDNIAINTVVYDGTTPTGTGRIILEDGVFTIDKTGVLEPLRNQGYGEFIVRLLADKALLSGAEYIYLNSPENTVSFFEKLFFKRDIKSIGENGMVPMLLKLSELTSPCGHKCSK